MHNNGTESKRRLRFLLSTARTDGILSYFRHRLSQAEGPWRDVRHYALASYKAPLQPLADKVNLIKENIFRFTSSGKDYRFPPGSHRTSSRPLLLSFRAMTKAWSDRRLR